MKEKITKVLCIGAISVLTALSAHGIVLFQDNFNYPAGPIVTEAAPSWITPPTSAPTVGTTPDISANGANGVFIAGTNTATGDQPWALLTNGLAGMSFVLPASGWSTNTYPAGATIYYFASNAPVAAIYESFSLMANGPVTNAGYFNMLTGTNFSYGPRIFTTLTNATAGSYRVAIANGAAPANPTNGLVVPMDLTYGQPYTIVVRANLSAGTGTLWVNPVNETTATATVSPGTNLSASTLRGISVAANNSAAGVVAVTNNSGLCAVGLRNVGGNGALTIANMIVGTTFADVVPSSAGQNPPFVVTPPQAQTTYFGDTVTLSVVAGGDQGTIAYLWRTNGVPIADGSNPDGSTYTGSTSSTLTIANVGTDEGMSYSVAITNAAGGTASSAATLTVLTSQPTLAFVTQPTSLTITNGASANFSSVATAGGLPVSYQWYASSNNVSPLVPIPGQNGTNLTLLTSPVGTNLIKMVATDQFGSITSTNATLIVVPPAPVSATISFLRSLLNTTTWNTNAANTTNYTVIGTVTTWADMTVPGSTEFWMQDTNGAGITVFWNGAPASTNLPPAGAKVSVTGPLAVFNGLLEIEPTFSNPFQGVTILSTNNPLPAPLPLAFDPNFVANPTNMQKYTVGAYCVASNVFLTPGIISSANFPMTNGYLANQIYTYTFLNATNPIKGTNVTVKATNQNGQSFTVFYNSHTDVIGKTAPTGPVTIYGVMAIFNAASPFTSGYEFIPSRFADIIPALTFTNVLSNPARLGDNFTNSLSDSVVYPGETITISVSAGDPGGGTTTLTPGSTPVGAWGAAVGNGTTHATISFSFTASSLNAGNNYAVALASSYSSSGVTSTNTWNIYVPSTDEQQVYITEVFASPTSNTNSPAYNPLLRGVPDTNNIAVNDQYIEIANVSANSVPINNWRIVSGDGTLIHHFINGEVLTPGSSVVIYGGTLTSDPNPPTLPTGSSLAYLEPASAGAGLGLNSAGGAIAVYNNNYAINNNSGYLVDRVAYPASDSTNPSAFSRFPSLNNGLIPQAWISTNYVTPGAQYDGGSWSSPTKLPAGVLASVAYSNNTVSVSFIANTAQASTLWQAGNLANLPIQFQGHSEFQVINGKQFTNQPGLFQIANPPSTNQFYFITTQ
jgi:hypothetical protein